MAWTICWAENSLNAPGHEQEDKLLAGLSRRNSKVAHAVAAVDNRQITGTFSV
jgi:hypothetical protein